MKAVIWPEDKIAPLLQNKGRHFARVKTPHGWRTKAKKLLLPKDKKRLEGNCFLLAYYLASLFPNKFYYCEGYANGLPHAWVSFKEVDEDWCIDITWPWYSSKDSKTIYDDIVYEGIKFEVSDVKAFMLARLKAKGPNSTSMSMLKYVEEIQHLL